MKPWMKVAIPVAVVVVLIAAGGLYWFLKDDSPAEVSLEAAVESVSTTTVAGGSSTTQATTASGAVDIAGTWNVDTSTGEFDFESATGSFVGFRVQEELANIGATTAVGRTGDVDGSITIEGTTLTDANFTADLTTIKTDRSQRDSKAQGALKTDEFPEATFVLTQPIELGAGAANGEEVHVQAIGDLTVAGVTRPVTVALDGKLVDGTIVVTGSTQFTFDDFGLTKPTAPIVASLDDDITLELQLLFTKG